MTEELIKDLEKIGLSENEAKVYLASLELGPATAQQIAAKAIVSRPNTYIMIESLKKRGLMSSFEKGKKKYFVAGEPRQLLYVVEQKRNRLSEEEAVINSLSQKVVGLQSSASAATVSVSEGAEAGSAIRAELSDNDQEVFEIVPVDVVRRYIPPIFSGDIREGFSKKFTVKSICTGGPTRLVPASDNVEVRYIDAERFPIKAEILIFGNKVIVSTYRDKPVHIHITDQDVAQTMKTIFMSLWKQIEK